MNDYIWNDFFSPIYHHHKIHVCKKKKNDEIMALSSSNFLIHNFYIYEAFFAPVNNQVIHNLRHHYNTAVHIQLGA